MIKRPFWIDRVECAWNHASVVWLTGVRRVGKTTLARHWNQAVFFNCDLPRNRELLTDPESLLSQVEEPIVIFDEIHQLDDPSGVLKIAADEFPHLKVLATGASTLAATRKFRDSLTGRKRTVHLKPVLITELQDFGITRLEDRLLRGGLPDRLIHEKPDHEFYSEWLDSFFARDIQELFRVGKRHEFLRLCELLLRQSGEMCEVTSLSKHAGVSRPTIMNYLEILETTHFLNVLRPFHDGGRREIVTQPKAYAFDTGFVSHYRGWEQLRPEDCRLLFEHVILDLLQASLPGQRIHFWRDKQKREIDFVVPRPNGEVIAIECKWSKSKNTRNLDAFRSQYPQGMNIIVSGTGKTEPFESSLGQHRVRFCAPGDLPDLLAG